MPLEHTPDWHRLTFHAVGGLSEIGFSPDEDYVLAVSSAGRGLFRTSTGERVARDDSEPDMTSPWIRSAAKQVRGLGAASDVWFDVVGLWGGALPSRCEATGWSVRLEGHGRSVRAFLENTSRGVSHLVDDPITEVRAFGFSPSGRILVYATSSDLRLFALRS